MAHAHAQVIGRFLLLASLGIWMLASATVGDAALGAVEHSASLIGGGGLVAVASLYLVIEHRSSKRLDDRTERLIDHLEMLAGITRDDDESDDNDRD